MSAHDDNDDGCLTMPPELSFLQQYLNEPHKRTLPLAEELAIRYHLICERFDRAICKARDEHGDARPSSQMQYASINRHAEGLVHELLRMHPRCRMYELREQISKYGSNFTTKVLEQLAADYGIDA